MSEEYAKPVIELVQATPSTKEGIRKIVSTAEGAIGHIDEDLVFLLSQRQDLLAIVQQFNRLYRVILGEQLRTREQMEEIALLPARTGDTEDIRKAVLRLASSTARISESGEATDENILNQIKKEQFQIPWRNPKAVIATILIRSGKWEKVQPGVFKVGEEPKEQPV